MGIAAVAALVAGVWFAVNSETEADTTAARVLAVQTVSVEPVGAYQVAHEYTGLIVARRTSQLGFESAGKLQEIYFDEGDRVVAGASLARLDTEHLQTNRRKIVARRAQAAAKLDELINGPRAEDIGAARARIESLQAQVELLRLQTARHKRLVASNATSQHELEQYTFGLKARQAQLNEAEHDLAELINGTRKEQIDAGRAEVDELDAAIADIDVDLRKSTLRAPFDGTIARRLADHGTVVEAGRPILKLVEDGALEAWIGLPVQATQQLAEESVQRVKIDGQHFSATVAGRFPEVDPATRTRTVVLRLDPSASGQVVQGQVVRLQLKETVQAHGYWLPSTALTKGARGLWTTLVVVEAHPPRAAAQSPGLAATHSSDLAAAQSPDPVVAQSPDPVVAQSPDPVVAWSPDQTTPQLFRVERRELEVLHTESDRVLARGTLNPGDRVITGGTHRVVPGQLVRLAR